MAGTINLGEEVAKFEKASKFDRNEKKRPIIKRIRSKSSLV